MGGDIGFPTDVCVNNVAAHYTSPINDESVIVDGDLVKIDIGVAIEGYVADGAFTVLFNKEEANQNLILAVETAVLKGMSLIKPGVKTDVVAAATSKIIRGFGYRPIKDLTGHNLEKYHVHGGSSIPNTPIPKGTGDEFEEGDVYALECFASTGAGNIHASSRCFIYSYDITADRVPLRGKLVKRVIGWIGKNKQTLPWSSRELLNEFKGAQFAIKQLVKARKLIEHKVLIESNKEAMVAQFEHTFLITKDGIEQLT